MASKHELAAANMTIDELRQSIGADTLGFLSIAGAVAAVGQDQSNFCLACFNGDYPIPVPDEVSKHAFDDPPETGEFSTIGSGQLRLLEG